MGEKNTSVIAFTPEMNERKQEPERKGLDTGTKLFFFPSSVPAVRALTTLPVTSRRSKLKAKALQDLNKLENS